MQCWGSWDEEDYIFIVAAEPHKLPQYVMVIKILSAFIIQTIVESTLNASSNVVHMPFRNYIFIIP